MRRHSTRDYEGIVRMTLSEMRQLPVRFVNMCLNYRIRVQAHRNALQVIRAQAEEIARLNRIITAQADGYDALLSAAEWIGIDDDDFTRCTDAYKRAHARALAEGKG